MISISRRLLVIWLLGVVIATLAPFKFSAPGGTFLAFGAFERDPWHFALNLLLYLPLGVLLHHDACSRNRLQLETADGKAVDSFPLLLTVAVAALLLSATIECAQVFLPSRDSSSIDVLANVAGAVVGVLADRRYGRGSEQRLMRIRRATSPAVLAGLLGMLLLVSLIVSGTLQARTGLSNWTADYPLLVGNEDTGDRPWRGRVFAFDITDAATPAALVHRFSRGENVALPGDQVAAFVLTGRSPFRDAAGTVPDLEWTNSLRPTRRRDAAPATPPWLQSHKSASTMAERLRKANAFTLRVECATDDIAQEGPARVISNSASPYLRNFTLGQQGENLVFRLRTPGTGDNGYPLEISVPRVFVDRRRREILATYDGATLLVAAQGGRDVSRTELTPGSSVALAIPAFHVRPEELPVYELTYIAALSLVPGALIAFLGRTSRERRAFSLAWILVFALLLEATIVLVSGCAFDWTDIGRSIAVGAVVLALANAMLSHVDGESTGSRRRRIDILGGDALDYQPG
jgi:glycopeptide antibiotics resistance protein